MRDIKQIDIKTKSFRLISETPGHVTYGIWINGAKCGDLTCRLEERIAFYTLLRKAFG